MISRDFDISMFPGDGTGEKRVVCHSVDGIARNVVAGGELKANCDLRFFPSELENEPGDAK